MGPGQLLMCLGCRIVQAGCCPDQAIIVPSPRQSQGGFFLLQGPTLHCAAVLSVSGPCISSVTAQLYEVLPRVIWPESGWQEPFILVDDVCIGVASSYAQLLTVRSCVLLGIH